MACRLFGAKPLSEPMLLYCQLDPNKHISVKSYLKFKSFHPRKCTFENAVCEMAAIFLRPNVLNELCSGVSIVTMWVFRRELLWDHLVSTCHDYDNKFVFLLFQLGSIADRTITEADQDQDGHIAFEEFKKVSLQPKVISKRPSLSVLALSYHL